MPIRRWECPAALRVKSAVVAAAGAVVAGVFFPLWFGVPVVVLLGAWGLGMAVRRSQVLVDPDAGMLVFRVGLIARRVRLASVTAVQVDGAKVSIARSDGSEISVYAWRKSPLDRWLRVPDVAADVGHAISMAAAAAHADAAPRGDAAPREAPAPRFAGRARPARPARPARRPRAARQPLAVALLGVTGVLAVGAAFLVRVGWPNPVMTAFGAILALALGASGVFYVLFAVWLLVTGRARKIVRDFPPEIEGNPAR